MVTKPGSAEIPPPSRPRAEERARGMPGIHAVIALSLPAISL
jgi:hypothetical protein